MKKIDRIVDRLIEGRLVFFFGAGISMASRLEKDDTFEPKINWMAEQIFHRLNPDQPNGQFSVDGSLGRLIRNHSPNSTSHNFGYWVELAEWMFGQKVVCDTVRISDFADLQPLPAHYYVSWLAREGLIYEVITTNYDCCIESAYLRGLGYGPGDEVDRLSRVYSLDSYRERGARRQTREFKSVFQINKINGCAHAYRNGQIGPEQILLTERQLQRADSSRRRWVRDLLSDRIRRHSLCFVGFGSDEAQVRHTMLAVIDEFDDSAGAGCIPSADMANAPFVAAYDELSFVQAQLCWSFLKSVGQEDPRRLETRMADHVLDKRSAKALWDGETLDADNLLGLIYARAWHRKVVQALGRHAPYYRWLQNLVAAPRPWTEMLERWSGDLPSSMPWREALRLEKERFDGGEHLSCVGRWIAVAYQPHDKGSWNDRYYPLTSHNFFILTLLLLILALARGSDDGPVNLSALRERIKPIPGLGLGLMVVGENERAGEFALWCVLALGSRPVSPSIDSKTFGDMGNPRVVVRIGIPDHYLSRRSSIRRQGIPEGEGEGNGDVSTLRVVAVDGSQLIRRANRPEKIRGEIRKICARALGSENSVRRRLVRRAHTG